MIEFEENFWEICHHFDYFSRYYSFVLQLVWIFEKLDLKFKRFFSEELKTP